MKKYVYTFGSSDHYLTLSAYCQKKALKSEEEFVSCIITCTKL